MSTVPEIYQEVLLAESRIRPHIRESYVEHSPYFSQQMGGQLYLKLENLQHTGSFKVRGALNKVLSLTEVERMRGVVTASSGNHGAGVAYALGKSGAPGIVFVPESADPGKVAAIQRLGTEVRAYGQDTADTEAHARHYAQAAGLTYISPYNDPQVIGGQGSIGVELERQLPEVDVVFVALGGGGLISGVAAYLKTVRPGVQIVGCSPAHSQVMIQSVQAGRILDLPSLPTLSDGTAGGIEPGAITFGLCRSLVDHFVTVSEADIAHTVREVLTVHHLLIEGAAAVALAGCRQMAKQLVDRTVAVILCGGNMGIETLRTILA